MHQLRDQLQKIRESTPINSSTQEVITEDCTIYFAMREVKWEKHVTLNGKVSFTAEIPLFVEKLLPVLQGMKCPMYVHLFKNHNEKDIMVTVGTECPPEEIRCGIKVLILRNHPKKGKIGELRAEITSVKVSETVKACSVVNAEVWEMKVIPYIG